MMKKTLFTLGLFMLLAMSTSFAQQYALIDTEYILKRIPAYEDANKQLEALSKQWQTEVDKEAKKVEEMYKKYQADLKALQGEQKTKRENEIVAKESEIQKLRNKYFGHEGELMKRREALLKPIQDDIYEAVKDISIQQGYAMVMDRASAQSIIFASPSVDISDQVLSVLGY